MNARQQLVVDDKWPCSGERILLAPAEPIGDESLPEAYGPGVQVPLFCQPLFDPSESNAFM